MCGNMGSGSSGGGASKFNIKENGGFTYTSPDGFTATFQLREGKTYNVSDLSKIPQLMKTSKSISELAQTAAKNGNTVTILSPAQMQARVDERRREREARAGIDYELGVGVPWGNKNNRRAARQGRLATRAMRRR